MSELCPDCGHVAGVSEDRCGAALERFLGAEPNQQYRALCKLRSRIAQLEAVVEAAKCTVEAAKEMRNHTTGSEIAFITRDWFDNEARAYDAAKAELKRVITNE